MTAWAGAEARWVRVAIAASAVVLLAGCGTDDPVATDQGTVTVGPTTSTDDGAAAPTSTVAAAPRTPEQEDGPMQEERSYLEPTDESVAATIEFLGDGPFVMLNLFRLRDEPDFTDHPEMEPDTPQTSRELFYAYIAHMDDYLDQVGARRVLLADGGPMLIGPDGERWDVVQMVAYPSAQSFLELGLLVRDDVPLRAVMLSDSRIVPMHEVPLDAVG